MHLSTYFRSRRAQFAQLVIQPLKADISGFIQELESLKIYPVEVLAGLLYMGDQKQGMDSSILKDLKISAFISILQSDTQE